MNGAKGPCFGLLKIQSGDMTGDGHCTRDDATGERLILTWVTRGMIDAGPEYH